MKTVLSGQLQVQLPQVVIPQIKRTLRFNRAAQIPCYRNIKLREKRWKLGKISQQSVLAQFSFCYYKYRSTHISQIQ